jgi:hypothetical protein
LDPDFCILKGYSAKELPPNQSPLKVFLDIEVEVRIFATFNRALNVCINVTSGTAVSSSNAKNSAIVVTSRTALNYGSADTYGKFVISYYAVSNETIVISCASSTAIPPGTDFAIVTTGTDVCSKATVT